MALLSLFGPLHQRRCWHALMAPNTVNVCTRAVRRAAATDAAPSKNEGDWGGEDSYGAMREACE
jgi:hypothetical protein